jgi:transposase
MILNYNDIPNIQIICGKTDLRKGIDGLSQILRDKYALSAFENTLFLFCGGSLDRFKMLYWDGDGFLLLYKRLENGKLQWPRKTDDIRLLTHQQFRWLLEGLSIDQKRAISSTSVGNF